VASFADKVAQAPEAPGVYLLKDRSGKVIYIGKARNLRDRLAAYTQPHDDPRLASLVRRVADLETVVTRSEVEALVLEENFIKMKKPRYNVRLRDDKKFPYLKVTVQEPYPRIYLTRNIKPDGSAVFGPYTSARELRKALKAVKRIFKVRTCKREIQDQGTRDGRSQKPEARMQKSEIQNPKSKIQNPQPVRPCLDYQLNRCTAPCADYVSQAEYRQQVKDVIDFLSGRSDELVAELEQRMWQESKAEHFERAAILRDQVMALREIRREQQAVSQDKVNQDIIGLARGPKTAVAALFRIREGKITGREEYPLNATSDVADSEVLSTVLRSVHTHTADLPDEIVLPAAVEDSGAFEELLSERRGRKVRLLVPERGERVGLLDLARRNAEKALVELAPDERVAKANAELARLLGLDSVPRVIEGVDISNTQGTQAVGSIVVFRDDRPVKRDYRLFKVRTVEGPNDFAMMREVLARRVRGILEKNLPLPDLVLVDGGKPQLSAAIEAYHQYDADIPILGLAKRTDLLYFLDGREISIPVTSPALKLLKRIRDESHRFAITFHRKLRGKKQVESELDAIRGVGPARKKALIQHFGSLDKLRKASVEEIARTPGFGLTTAEKVFAELHGS